MDRDRQVTMRCNSTVTVSGNKNIQTDVKY